MDSVNYGLAADVYRRKTDLRSLGLFCSVSEPACFGAAPVPGIFYPEPAPAPGRREHNLEFLKLTTNILKYVFLPGTHVPVHIGPNLCLQVTAPGGSGSETLLFCIATVLSNGTGTSGMQFQLDENEYIFSVYYFGHVFRRAKKCCMETIYSTYLSALQTVSASAALVATESNRSAIAARTLSFLVLSDHRVQKTPVFYIQYKNKSAHANL